MNEKNFDLSKKDYIAQCTKHVENELRKKKNRQ